MCARACVVLFYLTVRTCENISMKVADILDFPLTKMSLMNSVNSFNSAVLEEIETLNIHDFGIFLELEPEEEEKAMLEQNIQIALQAGGIGLEDNYKLLLKKK